MDIDKNLPEVINEMTTVEPQWLVATTFGRLSTNNFSSSK